MTKAKAIFTEIVGNFLGFIVVFLFFFFASAFLVHNLRKTLHHPTGNVRFIDNRAECEYDVLGFVVDWDKCIVSGSRE